MKKILIIGSGNIAVRHAENLRHKVEGAEIALLTRSRQEELSKKWEDKLTCVFNEIEAARQWQPEMVIICSPASAHAEHLAAFGASAERILVEKPLALTAKDTGDAFSRCTAGAGCVVLGYNFRYSSAFLEVKKNLKKAEIGRVIKVHSVAGQYLPDWRALKDYRHSVSAQKKMGGGVLLELSHDIDLLLQLHAKPVHVRAELGTLSALELDVEDNADICMTHPDGVKSVVHLDFIRRPARREMEWIGTTGTIRWNLVRGHVEIFQTDRANEWITIYDNPSDVEDSYRNEIGAFLTADSGQTIRDQKSGNDVLEVIEAIRTSAQTGSRAGIKAEESK